MTFVLSSQLTSFCWMTVWTVEQMPSDHTGPIMLLFSSPQDWIRCLSALTSSFYPLIPPFFFFFNQTESHCLLSCPSPNPTLLPCVTNCHTFSLSPPAGVWLVKSGGCWRSSQSCKWGSPPGWPRHTVLQVRKPAVLPTKQRWERWEAVCTDIN